MAGRTAVTNDECQPPRLGSCHSPLVMDARAGDAQPPHNSVCVQTPEAKTRWDHSRLMY